MVANGESWCLVLSGGGAKGVYHIGVWRALRELGIEVRGFVGASIGAIIAGLLAQGDDRALEEIGRTIGVDSILALPDELTENGEVKLDLPSLSAVRELFRSLMDKKGLDTSPLRRILAERLDEAAIRASGKDLGIVTVNVSDLEPREVFLEDMEEGKLVDYLMASAAFPGFEQPVIAGKKYVDGGIHDNIPYAMARKRGWRRVIISDISGMGRNRKPEIEGSVTAYIKNSIDMGGILDFDRRFLDDFTLLGWLDTMRTFGRLKGYQYFLRPDPAAEAAFARDAAAYRGPKVPVPERMRYDRNLLLVHLECAAASLEVPRIKAYSYDDLRSAVLARKAEDDGRVASMAGAKGGGRPKLAAMLREAVANRSFDGSPYFYWRLIEEALPGTAGDVLQKALVGFYPELPAALAWLGGAGH
jgi:NTE family protein